MASLGLRELQGAFWRALVEQSPAAELTAVVEPSPRLEPAERIGIYTEMYLWRIVDALQENFPKLAARLGRERFADLVREYLRGHPSSHPSIRWVGRELPSFVGEREPEPGWLADLALLEWARLDVFDAPDVTPLTVGHLHDVAPEAWRFRLVPACTRLVTAWPVHRLWNDPETPLEPARTALRVWREGTAVYQTAMDPREEAALARLAAGASFTAACESFDDPAEAGALLLRWLEDGILADPDTGSPS